MANPKKIPCGGNRKGSIKNHLYQSTNMAFTEQGVIQEFLRFFNKVNLYTNDPIIADGKLHRVHIIGDKIGSKNGWYILFYGEGIPAGCFGSWKTGNVVKWCMKPYRELTCAQRKQNHNRMIEAQKIRQIEVEKRRKAAKNKANLIWNTVSKAQDTHPYLINKGIKSHGLRLYKKLLVVPMRDSVGNLHSLQFINKNGDKRFLSGGLKKGCYFSIGVPLDALCIAEGYATSASIHQATGYACAVAFDAGNLEPVAIVLRKKFPDLRIIICADNDTNTVGNPGVKKARVAASSIAASLAIPPQAGDFNDFFVGGHHE